MTLSLPVHIRDILYKKAQFFNMILITINEHFKAH